MSLPETGRKDNVLHLNPFERAREAQAREIYEEFSRVYRSVSPEVQRYAIQGLTMATREGVEGDQLARELWAMRDNLEFDRDPYDKTDKAEVGRLARVLSRMNWETAEMVLRMTMDDAVGVVREDDGLLELKTDQDLLNLPAVNWVIEGIIPQKSLAVVYGPPKQYKSFIVQAMAWSISCGTNWIGYPTVESPVLYIAGEGEWGMSKRYKAWRIKNGVPLDEHYPFYSYGRSINMADDREVDKLIRSIPEGTKLVIFDTLNRCMEGDENSAADVRAFVQGCDRLKEETGATVLIVHHSGKDVSKGMRGSSALKGSVDVSISVEKDQNSEDFVKIRCTDMKDYEEFKPFDLRREEVPLEDGESSLVFSISEYGPNDPKPPARDLPPAAQKFIDILKQQPDGLTVTELARLANVDRGTFYDHRPKLERQGLIIKDGRKWRYDGD